MNTVTKLSAQKTAERLIPVLRDYADKLSDLNARAAGLIERMERSNRELEQAGLEAARLVCLRAAIDRSLGEVGQNASGLLEHAALEHVTWLELKLRLDEVEEHQRFAAAVAGRLKALLADFPGVGKIRKLATEGLYKAPF